jgi:hypothetical protein
VVEEEERCQKKALVLETKKDWVVEEVSLDLQQEPDEQISFLHHVLFDL